MSNSKKNKTKPWVYGVCAAVASIAVLAVPAWSDVTNSLQPGPFQGTTSAKCIVIESKFDANFADGTACSNVYSANPDGSRGKQLEFKDLQNLPAGTQLVICSDQIAGAGYIATTPLKDTPPYQMVSGLKACAK